MSRYLLFLPLVILSIATQASGMRYKKLSHTGKVHHQINTRHSDPAPAEINTGAVCPDDLLLFAQTLIGTPYHFASANPGYGFDCSGFVGYVFHNFDIPVPRSSQDYANVGEKVKLDEAQPGDIILFTGTKTRSRRVGHVGIILSNNGDEVKFIHSTSGKEHGVTITVMDDYYRHRFVRIVRLFKQNDTAENIASISQTKTGEAN